MTDALCGNFILFLYHPSKQGMLRKNRKETQEISLLSKMMLTSKGVPTFPKAEVRE